MDPLHADADLQRQDQRRRLLRDRAAADRGQLGRPRRRALLVVVPVDADVLHLGRLPARDLARAAVARLHRGDRRHLHGPRQRRPGRRPRPVRADLRLHELRDRRPGPGRASTSSTGSTTAPPSSTPRATWATSRCGSWSSRWSTSAAGSSPTRAAGDGTAAARRSRRCCWSTARPDFEIENIGAGGMFTSPGLFGGYPAPSAYVHNVFGSDIYEQAARRRGLPGRRRQRRGARAERVRAASTSSSRTRTR